MGIGGSSLWQSSYYGLEGDNMKPKLIFLMALLALVLAVPAMAVNMSISDMGFTGPQTIQIYTNGTLAGTYNTTGNGIPMPSQDFILVIKPESSSYLKNPANLLDEGFAFVETHYIEILFVFFLLGAIGWLGRR